jgi:hypothetical protein
MEASMAKSKDNRQRGSVWTNKKRGFKPSVGSYQYHGAKKRFGNDRFFLLTASKPRKTRAYESPQAAIRDGWFIFTHGK